MATYEKYTPKDYIIDIGGVPLVGWVTSEASKDDDLVSDRYDVNGNGQFVENPKKSHTITVTVFRGSPDNALIQALVDAGTSFPIVITDKSSNGTAFFGSSCRLMTDPSENPENDYEYVFRALNGKITRSGYSEES